jgi:hypothetical protein
MSSKAIEYLQKNRVLVIGMAIVGLALVWVYWSRATSSRADNPIPEVVDFNYHVRPILSDRCFKCHGPDANKRQADLRLDTEEGAFAALKDNPQSHAIVPGHPELSEVFQRIINKDTSMIMPPVTANLELTQVEIQIIEKWIKQGAKYKPHWAFILPKKTALPEVHKKNWVKSPIDQFVLAKMEEHGLTPNAEADKERLLKRLSLDITGLLPDVGIQDKYLKDESPQAYERVVDELLKSTHYGEKMAISWLDLARYADSHGYQDDGLRTMWPWRDWVIHAFNQNYGYDQFLTWQLAGDLLEKPSKEMLLATGFNRNHKITQEGGVIDEEYRVEYVNDRTNVFSKTFLALTYECAKCHDHKYDPISQKDYYSTFAFFNQVPEKGIFGTIDASFADPPNLKITSTDIKDILRFINKKDTASVTVMVMQNMDTLRKTYVLNRGSYDQPTDRVGFTAPKAILPFDTAKYAKNRLGLAKWLVDRRNPLTARVFVNRVWQDIFGRGIVKTSGDFGMQGELPTHPELLDWLAIDFMDHGWNIKRLVKQMVLSATYRQSSATNKTKQARDPENTYLSHAPRLRLPAELVRDVVLSSSGLLDPEIGGPSVKPYQPKGIWEVATSGRGSLSRYVQDHGQSLYRRGMYVFIKRTVPPPTMLIFDSSNRDQCEVKRSRTNTPLQALVMLNDPTILEASRVMAEKLMQENSSTESKINKAFRIILCRKTEDQEKKVLLKYFTDEKNELGRKPKLAALLLQVGEAPMAKIVDPISEAALMETIHMLYNLEETITK